jgi:recombination protein RecA
MSKKGGWLSALSGAGLEVKSARDALQVKGWLDTGNYALNWAISGRLLGGYPLGHCGEIFGDPGTGKSYLASRAIAMAQLAGGVALLDDVEGAYNAERAANSGIDVDTLAVADPRSATVDDHLKLTKAFIEAVRSTKATLGLEVLDSLAQLSTKHEKEVGLDKKDMTKASELKAFYRLVGHDLFDLPVAHIATNHKIAAIGNMFQQSTTPGGGGPKFIASWRVDLRAVSKIRRGPEILGVICRAVVDKNRIAAPWKEVRLAIPFEQPLSRASGLVPLLVSLGIVQEQGQFLYKDGQKLGRAYKTKERFLAQDETGEQILDQFPELLEDADKAIAAGLTKPVISDETQEEDAVEEQD